MCICEVRIWSIKWTEVMKKERLIRATYTGTLRAVTFELNQLPVLLVWQGSRSRLQPEIIYQHRSMSETVRKSTIRTQVFTIIFTTITLKEGKPYYIGSTCVTVSSIIHDLIASSSTPNSIQIILLNNTWFQNQRPKWLTANTDAERPTTISRRFNATSSDSLAWHLTPA